jgi:hypothetical protein
MADPPNVREALNTLVECSNEGKPKSQHITYDYARHLAILQFQELKRGNGEVGLIDGVYGALRLYCPQLFKKESAPAPASVPAPAPEAQPKIDEANLLLRLKKMKQLSDGKTKFEKGNPYTSVSDEAFRKSYNEGKERLEKKLDELGGPLTQEQLDYVYSISDGVMKSFLAQISKGKGRGGKKSCPKCGLPK